ncbi:MAG TPA: hypothetical protein DDX84_05460 [Nitrospiraceae bacterium]|nr:hypothetical protein [Nitrospiraceae bacterium]
MLKTLHKYFGYTTFLPLQEDIIRDVMDRKDVLVLMPTGGGKSLCYQLPALLFDGLTVVISPLIALMKDQVDGLISNGISAAYINSSLSYSEVSNIRWMVENGEVKILYLAPERLMVSGFLDFLKRLAISLFAVDEAHCISEWGHDFRPEYRQLKTLRENFPGTPLIALTATATGNVQDDIARQLNIPGCRRYQAGFNRKNLYYRVEPKVAPYQQLLKHLEGHKKESGIIYCQSRKMVDSLSASLQEAGYRAMPYHAGLTAEQRGENQERFIRDDAEIIVATIAFGMGIDKPNVRYVIHYDLPKNLEGYYQETGRAGRDGLPSDCILFFSYGDKVKIEYFISQKEDQRVRDISYQKLKKMTDYCSGNICRRKVLLEYFGEDFDDSNCGGCDICLEPRPVLKLNDKSRKVLFKGEKVSLTKPVMEPHKLHADVMDAFDRDMFEILRTLRKKLADEEGVPLYIIFPDTTLKEMATYYPNDFPSLSNISGIGEKKLQRYGNIFLNSITEYCRAKGIKPKQIIPEWPTPILKSLSKELKPSTLRMTLEFFNKGMTLEEMAEKRGLAVSTITSHIEKLILSGENISIDSLVSVERQEIIIKTIDDLKSEALRPVKEILGDSFSYEEIRLVRASIRSKSKR